MTRALRASFKCDRLRFFFFFSVFFFFYLRIRAQVCAVINMNGKKKKKQESPLNCVESMKRASEVSLFAVVFHELVKRAGGGKKEGNN